MSQPLLMPPKVSAWQHVPSERSTGAWMNGLPARTIDNVVVGAGPGGLAASAALTGRGIEHLVLVRGRVGQTWRDQRWDSLRLNNPGWMNAMLGPQPPHTYLTAREVLSRLGSLAGACPVREFTPVTGLVPDKGRWRVQVGAGSIQARYCRDRHRR